MTTIIIENIIKIVAMLVITAIGVAGTWLTAKLGRQAQLGNIKLATDELIKMSQTTVLELQQTIVDDLKAKSSSGKLSQNDIVNLGELLVAQTKDKLSASTIAVIDAAGIDIAAIIRGAGEAFIRKMK